MDEAGENYKDVMQEARHQAGLLRVQGSVDRDLVVLRRHHEAKTYKTKTTQEVLRVGVAGQEHRPGQIIQNDEGDSKHKEPNHQNGDPPGTAFGGDRRWWGVPRRRGWWLGHPS